MPINSMPTVYSEANGEVLLQLIRTSLTGILAEQAMHFVFEGMWANALQLIINRRWLNDQTKNRVPGPK